MSELKTTLPMLEQCMTDPDLHQYLTSRDVDNLIHDARLAHDLAARLEQAERKRSSEYDFLSEVVSDAKNSAGVFRMRCSPDLPDYVREMERGRDEARRDAERIRALHYLAAQDVVFFSTYDIQTDQHSTTTGFPCVLSNDIFGSGADAELLPDDQILRLERIYREYGHDGVIAWLCERTGLTPWRPERYPNLPNVRAAIAREKGRGHE